MGTYTNQQIAVLQAQINGAAASLRAGDAVGVTNYLKGSRSI
jgi:hypothetical protein